MDVSEAGLGACRRDADRDDRLAGLGDRGAQETLVLAVVADERIGGQHGDDGVGTGAARGGDGAQAHGGRRVPRRGLGDDVGGGQRRHGRPNLFLLVGGRDDERALEAHDGSRAAHGGRQERLRAAERQELLGPRAAARGPKARPAAARQDDREGGDRGRG